MTTAPNNEALAVARVRVGIRRGRGDDSALLYDAEILLAWADDRIGETSARYLSHGARRAA